VPGLVAAATAPTAVIVSLTSLAVPIAIPTTPRVASAGVDSGIGEGRGCAAIEAATAAIKAAAAAAAAIGEATAATAAAIGEATPTTTTAIKAPGCTLYAFRSRGRTVAVEAPSGAASTTAAARALLRLVDAEGAAIELLPVHRRNRRFGIGVVRHFHEGEPSGTTGFPIRHDEDAGDLPPVCTE